MISISFQLKRISYKFKNITEFIEDFELNDFLKTYID